MSTFGKRGGGGRRKAARENLPLIAVFTTMTCSYTAELVDVSATGARLRATHAPDEGEEIFLSVDKLKTFGVVAWSHDQEFGVTFDLQFAEEDVDYLRSKVARTVGLTADMRLALDLWAAGSVS